MHERLRRLEHAMSSGESCPACAERSRHIYTENEAATLERCPVCGCELEYWPFTFDFAAAAPGDRSPSGELEGAHDS